MKHFKAKIPFSSEHGIFNPGDERPGKAPNDMVDAWVKAGYAEEVTVVEVEKETQATIKETTKEGDEYKTFEYSEAQNEPILNDTPAEGQDTQTEEKSVVIEGKPDPTSEFEAMSYPQLKKAAKAAGIKNYQSMKQTDLVKALKRG
jgi:hypothetical protein